jgi:tetratricopeptide (TPR) repeat protein
MKSRQNDEKNVNRELEKRLLEIDYELWEFLGQTGKIIFSITNWESYRRAAESTKTQLTEPIPGADPRNKAVEDAEQWFLEGTNAASAGPFGIWENYEKAIECFDKAVALNPNVGYVWKYKGYALNALGRKHEAEECFKKAEMLGYSKY